MKPLNGDPPKVTMYYPLYLTREQTRAERWLLWFRMTLWSIKRAVFQWRNVCLVVVWVGNLIVNFSAKNLAATSLGVLLITIGAYVYGASRDGVST